MPTQHEDYEKDVNTVKELAILFAAEMRRLSDQSAEANEKIDKIFTCLYGNGQEGLRTTIIKHDEFIKKAIEERVLEEARANTKFRETVKMFVLKVVLAAVCSGGAGAAIWQALSSAF